MSRNSFLAQRSRHVLMAMLLISLAACMPGASLAPQPGPVEAVEPATPTAEIFNPLVPAPTPSGSRLPLTCQATDLNIHVNETWGYCFAFPLNFSVDETPESGERVSVSGPALDGAGDPLRARLEVAAQLLEGGSDLSALVDAYLASLGDIPWTINHTPMLLGGEPAVQLEPVPGLLSSRVIMALHNNILYTLQFHPSDLELAKPDLEALAQTVTGSFEFLPGNVQPPARPLTAEWLEFDRVIALTYPSSLAPWMAAATAPAEPVSDQILFAKSHPPYAQFRFLGYQSGRRYELPLLPSKIKPHR